MNEALEAHNWREGARVTREDSQELGTIVEVDGEIKVKWDRGRTSYYRGKNPAKIRVVDTAAAYGALTRLGAGLPQLAATSLQFEPTCGVSVHIYNQVFSDLG